MRRIRRSALPTALLAGTLLFGAAACSDDGGQELEDDVQTEDTGTGTGTGTETGTELEDPLTGNTGTETEATG